MSDKVYVGQNAASLEKTGAFDLITRVMVWYDEENAYTAGDDTGRTLEMECPWATQTMADNILASVKGFAYRPFEATGALLDPAAELGDGITMNGLYSMLAHTDISFDAMCAVDAAAPGEKEVDSEYPYEDPQERALKRKVTLGTSYYGTRITRREGLVVEKKDGESITAKAVLNADELSFYNGSNQRVLYFDPTTQTYKFEGVLNVADNFIVDKAGNVTMKGSINLSGGSITWGGNNPASGCITSGQAQTIINNTLVSSPNIAGAKFWDIDQSAYLEMTSEAAGMGQQWADMVVHGAVGELIRFSQYGNSISGDSWVKIASSTPILPLGTWDFSGATVTGITAEFGE